MYEYVKVRSKSQSPGLCFDSVNSVDAFETEGNTGSELSAGLLVVITRWLRNTFNTTEVLFIYLCPLGKETKLKSRTHVF